MPKHLPFSDYDMSGIYVHVNHYKSVGLKADFSVVRRQEGVVSIVLENPITRDGSLACFEIHKLARPGWFREKAWWVVQLYSKGPTDKQFEKRGCVSARTQAYALSEAEADLRFNFMSICDFELASQGWDNRS